MRGSNIFDLVARACTCIVSQLPGYDTRARVAYPGIFVASIVSHLNCELCPINTVYRYHAGPSDNLVLTDNLDK